MKFKTSLFLLMFVIPVFFMVLLGIYVAGGTTLTCRRVESTQIDCTLSNRRWLGQVNAGDTTLKHLAGARIESYPCDDTDANGRRRTKSCESLVLDTAAGAVSPDLLPASAAEINNFVASNTETTLTVYNNRWIFSAAISGFALVWLGAGIFIWRQLNSEQF